MLKKWTRFLVLQSRIWQRIKSFVFCKTYNVKSIKNPSEFLKGFLKFYGFFTNSLKPSP